MKLKTHTCSSFSANDDRGSALLMTLGVLLLMLIIGLGFMFSAMTDRSVADNQSENGKAKLAAESASARAMAILQKRHDVASLADPKVSFSPYHTALFSSSPANGTYRFPTLGYLEILKDSTLPTSSTNPKIGEMTVTILNRTGKLDPNWFGRPTQDFTQVSSDTWNLITPASPYSNGGTPVMTGFLLDGSAASNTVRNNLFVASPELRKAILAPATTPPWTGFATLPKDYQTWGSRDQIFLKAGWNLASYNPGGASNNQDFLFPRSPNPIALQADGITPDTPDKGGSNTFIDWGGVDDTSKAAQWRNAALLPLPRSPVVAGDPVIRQRMPVAWFANLNLSATATATGADIQMTGTGSSVFDGQTVGSCLPWFRMQYDRRVVDNTDPSSYYELLANFKDYATAADAPTTNVWPVSASAFSTAMISNPAASVPYPFCGTKAVPNISEIKLDYNKTAGLNTATAVELVNLYGSAWNLNDLAAVIEAEWTDNSSGTPVLKTPQVAVVGFGTSGLLPSLAVSTSFRSLTANVATTKATTSRIRAYLVYSPGIGGNIGSVSAATLRSATLLDAAILDSVDSVESGTGSGSAVAPPAGSSLAGCTLTVPVTALNRSSSSQAKKGELYTYSGIMYVVVQQHKPKDVTGAVGSANFLAYYRALNPQPSPLNATGIFTCTMQGPGATIQPGEMFGYNYDAITKKVKIYVVDDTASKTTTAVQPPKNGNANFQAVGTCTISSGSITLQPVYFEARDPRNNTRGSNQGINLWKGGTEGSFGKVNPDWWNQIPDLATLTGQALAVGDLVWSGGFEYEVKTAHVAGAQAVTNTTYFTGRTGLSGRDVWFDDDGDLTTARTENLTEDDVPIKPRDGIAAATAPATVDNYIRPSTAYVRRGAPQSLWELGAINRAEPWRTVKLSGGQLMPTPLAATPVNLGDYAMGDWMLLDEVSLYPSTAAGDTPNITNGYKTENGKANPNADVSSTPGMQQLFVALGRCSNAELASPKTAYECQAPTVRLINPPDVNLVTFAGIFTSAPLLSRSELAVNNSYLPTLWYLNGATSDPAGRPYATLDRSREEILGKAANLLQTRYQYFEVLATGRSYKGNENPQLTGSHVIRLMVERDAYTGKIRTVSHEHIDQ
jgi:hypothetical protein